MRSNRLLVLVTAIVFAVALAEGGTRRKRFLDFDQDDYFRSLGDSMRQIREQAQEMARRTVDGILDQTRDLVSTAQERTSQAVSSARDRTRDMLDDMMSDQPRATEREIEETPRRSSDGSDVEMPVVIVDKGMQKPEDPWVAVDLPDMGPRSFFSFDRFPKPWWNGPNVCKETAQIEENENERDGKDNSTSIFHSFSIHASSCYETETSYICKTRIRTADENKNEIVKYQCCHGFARKPGTPGCVELDLKDLVQTLKDLGADKMTELAKSAELLDRLHNDNLTIFAPTNEAWTDYEADNENNEIDRSVAMFNIDTTSLLVSHMTKGFLRSGDFIDEEVLPTEGDQPGIRMNVYHVPNKVITANCARLVSANNYARNGIVHMVDRVLPQPTRTVADIISSDPQFSILKGMLSEAGLVQTLRDPKGHFTLFAPTDTVFYSDTVDSELVKQLREGKGCSHSILRNHLLPNVICSSAIPATARTINVIDEHLTLTRDDNDKLFVNGVQIVARDIVGTNGVVHIIDGILVPEKAKTMSQALRDNGREDLVELFESAGLLQTLDETQNITLFAPSRYALRAMSNETLEEMREDPSMLQFHVATTKEDMRAIHNNELLDTLDSDKQLRMNIYSEFPGITYKALAQCGQVISANHEVCGGMIHVVDKVLMPPKGNIIQVLEEMGDFDFVLRLLNISGLATRLQDSGPYTLLAPKDEAFYKLPESFITSLLEDRSKATRLMKQHILSEHICCSRISPMSFFNWQEVRALDGTLITTHRNTFNRVRFGSSHVLKCDVMATNGVIHVMNRVLRRDRLSSPFESDMFRLFF